MAYDLLSNERLQWKGFQVFTVTSKQWQYIVFISHHSFCCNLFCMFFFFIFMFPVSFSFFFSKLTFPPMSDSLTSCLVFHITTVYPTLIRSIWVFILCFVVSMYRPSPVHPFASAPFAYAFLVLLPSPCWFGCLVSQIRIVSTVFNLPKPLLFAVSHAFEPFTFPNAWAEKWQIFTYSLESKEIKNYVLKSNK